MGEPGFTEGVLQALVVRHGRDAPNVVSWWCRDGFAGIFDSGFKRLGPKVAVTVTPFERSDGFGLRV